MTKVYLVKEGGGSWEDKWEVIHSAWFDKEKSESVMAELKKDWDNSGNKLDLLHDHVTTCDFIYEEDSEDESCHMCDEFYELQDELEDGKYYTIEEIEVE